MAHILRQETLDEDLRELAGKLDLAIHIGDRRVNSSRRNDYRKYYSDADRQRVALRHKDDLELFGYKF